MMMICNMRIFLVLIILSATCLGVTRNWTNTSGDGRWANPSNWSPAGIPGLSDPVIVDGQKSVLVDDGTIAQMGNNSQFGYVNAGPTRVVVTGGTLTQTATNYFIISNSPTVTAEMKITGGAVNVGTIWLGYAGGATLTMSGGSLTCGTLQPCIAEGATAKINITGGTLTVTSMLFAPWNADGNVDIHVDGGVLKVGSLFGSDWSAFDGTLPNTHFDITEGTFVISGNVASVKGLTAYGGEGSLLYMYDASIGSTIITAVNYSVAKDPVPSQQASNASTNTILNWTAGLGAVSHDIYLGTDYIAVRDATHGSTEYKGNVSIHSYNPSGLAYPGTYYWRIDEISSGITHKGVVWQFSTCTATAASSYYVSQDGNDLNAGTLGQPFKTLEKARDTLRINAIPPGGTTVYLRGGKYFRTVEFNLTSQDSGSPDRPIVYCSFPGEEARIIGGVQIPSASFAIVTSADAVWNRLAAAAQGSVMKVNLPSIGISNYGQLLQRGYGYTAHSAMELSYNKTIMQLARWPNTGFEKIAAPTTTTSFSYTGTEPSKWTSATDAWIFGYFQFDWMDSYVKVASIDTANKKINLAMTPQGTPTANSNWYALNLFEELDVPGEWYVDRSTGILYFWPPSDINSGEVLVSTLGENRERIIKTSGTRNVTFRGLTIEMCRFDGIRLENGGSVSFDGCVIRNVGTMGASVFGGTNHSIVNCEIYSPGDQGISLSGGDRYNLMPSNHRIQNCEIHHFGRWTRTYKPGIAMEGVGNTIYNNLLHDAPHSAEIHGLQIGANNNSIWYNEIYNVCLEGLDAGAIYSGNDWGNRGNDIRYNFIHDLPVGPAAIYLDDCVSGHTIFGNTFYRIGSIAVFNGGGRDNKIQNNVIAKCGIAHYADRRGVGMIVSTPGDSHNLLEKIRRYNYQQPPWSTSYPALAAIPNDYNSPGYIAAKNPGGSVFSQNMGWQNTTWTQEGAYLGGYGAFGYYAEIANNISNQNPLFVDEASLNLKLQDTSPAFTIPGFTAIPFEQIGLQVEAPAISLKAGQCGFVAVSGKSIPWSVITTAVIYESGIDIRSYLSMADNGAISGNIPSSMAVSGTMTVEITVSDPRGKNFANSLSNTLQVKFGDLTCDNAVNIEDFAMLAKHWLEANCGTCSGADLSGDGTVDFKDVEQLVAVWLQ